MGCVGSAEHHCESGRPHNDQMMWLDSPVGKLIIDVKNVYLNKVEKRHYKKADILMKFKLSNQDEKISYSELQAKPQSQRKIAFSINSCYKYYGRFLIIQTWSLIGDAKYQAGIGIIDLKDSIRDIKQRVTQKQYKCHINYESSPAGFIEFQAQFIKHQYQQLSFRVNSAIFQQQTSIKNKFATKITIGEETLETKQTNPNERNQLFWKNQILSFRVPDFLSMGKLEIVEKKGSSRVFRGEYKLDLKFFLREKNQLEIDDEIFHQDMISGKVRISSIKGFKSNQTFRELDSPLRKGQKVTSIRLIDDATYTDYRNGNREGLMEVQQSDIVPVTNEPKRVVSLPPIQIDEALKKLQKRRQKLARDN